MLCKISDLIAEVPSADGLYDRCRAYLQEGKTGPDIIIRSGAYRRDKYPTYVSDEMIAYMESAFQFYTQLINYGGFYLHSSAVVKDGKAYLFSGDPGAGKSTHAQLWVNTFGGDTRIINDDKPALRCVDGIWYAYGTPWCGKDGINLNDKAPVAGICFMKKSDRNSIRRLSSKEAMIRILGQTLYLLEEERSGLFAAHLDSFLRSVPVFELENRPEPEAAMLSFETMYNEAML